MDKTSAVLPGALDSLSIDRQAPAPDANELGQAQFLELMVTQLQNQDPFQPMESGDFLGQIAQFSTVSGISDLQGSFASLATSLQSSQALQASTMVGRQVRYEASQFALDTGDTPEFLTDLPNAASDVRVTISTASGAVVRQQQLGAHGEGPLLYQFDGLDSAGEALPSGQYRISFDAFIDGEEQALTSAVTARVDSVTLSRDGSGPTLNVAGYGAVAMHDVLEIL